MKDSEIRRRLDRIDYSLGLLAHTLMDLQDHEFDTVRGEVEAAQNLRAAGRLIDRRYRPEKYGDDG